MVISKESATYVLSVLIGGITSSVGAEEARKIVTDLALNDELWAVLSTASPKMNGFAQECVAEARASSAKVPS